MEGTMLATTDGSRHEANPVLTSPLDWGVLAALLLWQGWMTLGLFGTNDPFNNLLNDQPIVSGRHPLHLYHGYLGAQSFWDNWTLTCFDPAFQAGYPKTPVYDSGSRPAELFLFWGRGEFQPALYKIGMTCCWLAVPLALWLAAGALGLRGGSRSLAVALAMLVWWGKPGSELTAAGDLDLMLGSVALLSLACALVKLHSQPRGRAFVAVFVAAALAWFTSPVLCLLYAPAILIYYVSVGPRHQVGWHLGLLTAQAGALFVNGFWLAQWFEYWWLLSPLRADEPLLAHRTPRLIWNSPHWGDSLDRGLTWILLAGGVGGILIWNQTCRRSAARLLGCGLVTFLLISVGGLVFDTLTRWSAHRLVVTALLFASMPTALCLGVITGRLVRLARTSRTQLCVIGTCIAAVIFIFWPLRAELFARCLKPAPLIVGLSESQRAFTKCIDRLTTPEARILFESIPEGEGESRWSSLLPILTDRAYLGGLDPEARIEHAFANLVQQELAGRRIERWRDEELATFMRRYNVGWIACRSSRVVDRFKTWSEAELIAGPETTGGNWIFRLQPRSFILQGQARVVQADRRSIVLADLAPGRVVLSMHYQSGMQVLPSQIQLEKDPDPSDPIPFIRLNVREPVSRAIIYWRDP
jgi:hypothetical protein